MKLWIVVVFGLLLAGSEGFSQGKSKQPKKSRQGKEVGPPPWAPAHGYRAKTRYVYFKDYDVYYDNERGVYISLSGKNWTVSAKLPLSLSSVDLVAAVKVDIDFSGDDPQREHKMHAAKYPKKK